MSRGSFYKGTSIEQDARFKNKEKLLLEKKNFPKEYEMKVDIAKVELKVIRSWIEKRITEILGFDDEFLVNYIISLLENKSEEIDPKKIQILLTGFLDNETPAFMKDLWNLLLSAQISPNGIPAEIIREKEKELRQQTENKNEKIKFLEKMLGDKLPEKNKINYSESKSEMSRSRERSRSRDRERKHRNHRNDDEKHKKHSKKRKHSRSIDKKRKKSHKDRKYKKRSSSSKSSSSSQSSRTPSRSRSRS